MWRNDGMRVEILKRKTKRPELDLSPGRLLISPPPSAAQEQSYIWLQILGMARPCYGMARKLWAAGVSFSRKTKRPELNLSPGRLLISPPPSAAQRQCNSESES
jgi:hypothetical protein